MITWKRLVGDYWVGDCGAILSFKRGPSKEIKFGETEWGYKVFATWKDGKGKMTYLHRAVAEVFIPNPEDKPEINHIDGDKSNNNVSNLEWCTRSENMLHAYKIGIR